VGSVGILPTFGVRRVIAALGLGLSGRYATQITNKPFPWVKTHGYDHQSLRDERPLSRSDNAY